MIKILKKTLNKLYIYLRVILLLPSRLIFGNCISIHKNVVPYAQFFYIKKLFKKKTELENKGIVFYKYNLDKNIITNIKKNFDILINDPKNEYSLSGKQKIINSPLKLGDLKQIIQIFDKDLREYYEGSYKFLSVKSWRNYHDASKNSNKEKYIYSNYWHYDSCRPDILKIFILLNNNTNANSGSTKAIDISTSKIVTRNFKFIDTSLSTKRLDKYLKKTNSIISCDGDLGDVYIVNTSKCLHSATIPDQNCFRDVIQLETIKSKTNFDPFNNFLNVA